MPPTIRNESRRHGYASHAADVIDLGDESSELESCEDVKWSVKEMLLHYKTEKGLIFCP